MERLIADISVSGGVWFSRPPWALGCSTCLCDPRDRWLGSDCVRQGFPIGSVSISHILGFLAYIIVPVPCTYNQSLSRCNWSAEYAREAVCWASPGSSHGTHLRWKSGGHLSPWSSLFFTWYTVLRKDWLNQDDKLFKPLNCFVEIQSRNIYMQLCDFAEHLHWFWCDARCFKGPNFLVLASITWHISFQKKPDRFYEGAKYQVLDSQTDRTEFPIQFPTNKGPILQANFQHDCQQRHSKIQTDS